MYKRTYHLLLILALIPLCGHTQTPVSGIINDYTSVIAFDFPNNTVTVNSTANFSIGDKVLIIQMQGATIDESQGTSFGTINNYNDAGNYEVKTVCNINGNDIVVNGAFLNTYDPAGKVQVVRIPVYDDAIISGGDLTASPWNGTVGGILILEVNGTLDFGTQNIDMNETGFQGGNAIPSGSGCSFVSDDSYYTSLTDVDETALKGEGISQSITNKECGRGPMANGGGGGNNHNAGGCGGGNYGEGGAGGQRIKSSAFTCGSLTGVNSKELTAGYSSNKIFMGGGGGAGHGNNSTITGENGYNGGGIVIIMADNIEGNNQNIFTNGGSSTINSFCEGGGGAGAGGTVLLKVNNFNSGLNVFAEGGNGTDVDNVGTSNCSGPGGGGGGGLVWVSGSAVPPNLIVSVAGGTAGITATTSQSNCTVGDSNGAIDGQPGGYLTDLVIPEIIEINNITETACGSYTVPSGDETYTSSGVYSDTLTDTHGCDSILSIDLIISQNSSSSISVVQCENYTVPSGDETYSVSGIYTDTIPNTPGCDSVITIDLTIQPVDISVTQNGFELAANASPSTYQWIDCSTGDPIPGETGQNFITSSDGNFAVIVTQGSCTDTSECYQITGTGILENTFESQLVVAPNPFASEVVIRFDITQERPEIIITDISGSVVFNRYYTDCIEIKIDENFARGVYLMTINSGNQKAVIKLIKQ